MALGMPLPPTMEGKAWQPRSRAQKRGMPPPENLLRLRRSAPSGMRFKFSAFGIVTYFEGGDHVLIRILSVSAIFLRKVVINPLQEFVFAEAHLEGAGRARV